MTQLQSQRRTKSLTQNRLRLHADTLHAIDHHQSAVGDAQRGSHLCIQSEYGTKPRA